MGTFDKAERRTINFNSITPGPGRYNTIENKKDTPEYSFTQSNRYSKEMGSTVGPGSYNVPSQLRTDRGAHVIPRRKSFFDIA